MNKPPDNVMLLGGLHQEIQPDQDDMLVFGYAKKTVRNTTSAYTETGQYSSTVTNHSPIKTSARRSWIGSQSSLKLFANVSKEE